MAEIFVSHSASDGDLVNFFARIAAGSQVKLIFEEFEKILTGQVDAARVRSDIERSKAVFVLVSPNVHDIPHTRDWVVWESGVAVNRDIWVFERLSDLGKVPVVTPHLRHYVLYEPNDSWHAYVRAILHSYDDSHVLGTVLLSAGIASALSRRTDAALAGALAGLVMSDRTAQRPVGVGVRCGNCASTYGVHLPKGQIQFRCPVCNRFLALQS